MKNAENELEKEQINKDQEMGVDENPRHNNKDNSYKDFIKSLISFNKGGNWRRIIAPDRDLDGRKYDCGDYCFLNLSGVSGDFPSFYSVESAAGLILANGNVGRYLSYNHEDVSTFLSRDGGLNWFEIRKGSHIYEMGDHGALILIADDQKPTTEIYYSWDEGLTFEPLKISEEKLLIKNIIIEPTSTSQHFVVYGEVQKKGNSRGIAIGVDFSGLHEPQCKNADSPDIPESDYERWTPNDGKTGHGCLLGHKTIYIRRKREAKCYNGLLFERKIVSENCDCIEEDYECDVGYARSDVGEPCISTYKRVDELDVENPPANCNGFYRISKGYRKIPGNTCVNGVKYDPILIPCPYSGIFSYLGVIFVLILLAGIIVFVIITCAKYFFHGSPSLLNDRYPDKTKVNTRKIDYCNIVNIFL